MSTFDAVLLLAHGTPERIEDVPEYMRRVTAGRDLPQSVIDEVAHRFAAVGGSPLTRITAEQTQRLAAELNMPVYFGMRNWHLFIADSVARILADGRRNILALCLAPHNSRTSVGAYKRALDTAADGRLAITFIDQWHDDPKLIDAFAENLRETIAGDPHPAVLFTAHSVPTSTIADGDPYAEQTKQTAAAVAARLHIPRWRFAFQSQGMSGAMQWIGPTVEATLDEFAREGARRVILQPIGFITDNVEILYDIDVQFRDYSKTLGMELVRPPSLNTSPLLIAALRNIVLRAASQAHAHASRDNG